MKGVGEKIRVQRLVKNYSQEYMAWALNISQAAYSNIERGETEITLVRVFEIAEILEISAYLIMPKPKYGSTINYQIVESLVKFKKIWRALFQHSPIGPPKYLNGHSDTSKKGG
jgi:transcriptional regulator with XRE-family HTH domain